MMFMMAAPGARFPAAIFRPDGWKDSPPTIGDDPFPEATVLAKRLGKKIRFENLAIQGGREPVQFNRLHMYHDRIDMAVFLDGFNEMMFQALPEGSPACDYMVSYWNENRQAPAGFMQPLVEMRRHFEALAESRVWAPLRYSGLFKLYLFWLHAQSSDRILGYEQTLTTRTVSFVDGTDDEKARSWEGCNALSAEYAKSIGIPIFFFLQPNQYVKASKVFTEEERKCCLLSDAELSSPSKRGFARLNETYAKFEAQIEKLRARGNAAYSLTGVFRDVHEKVYQDNCCHLNFDGSYLMMREIVRRILERLPAQ